MTQRFTLDESRLLNLAACYPVQTDHDAMMAVDAAIHPSEGEPLITGPCEIAVDSLANGDGEIDAWRIIIFPDEEHPDAPWLGSRPVRSVEYLDRLPEPDEEGGLYDPAVIIRDAVDAANELLDWYKQATDSLTGPETDALRGLLAYNWDKEQADYPEQDDAGQAGHIFNSILLLDQALRRLQGIECCNRKLPYPRPGQEVRCGGCGSVYTTVLDPGWREWVSPQGVSHIIPPTGPCATCGSGRHDDDQETAS